MSFLTPTDKNEISFIKSSQDSYKASSPHSIVVKVLKPLKNYIFQQLIDIFNNILSQLGNIFQFWELLKSYLYIKNSQKLIIQSIVSILSNTEKIVEKPLYKRLCDFLDINNLIYSLQFDFQSKFATTHALINLTESIRQALDEGSIGCGIFVDLQKAFDTIDHNIVLHKLKYYEIWGGCNDWFKSYLSDYKQFASTNEYKSGLVPADFAVP